MTLTLTIKLAPGKRRPTTARVADLLEVHAQELRDEVDGGAVVSIPGHTLAMNGDVLEVGHELP